MNGTDSSYLLSHYAHTDFSFLSPLELSWTAWYAWFANDILATGVMSFVMHELVYFGRAIPWIIIDAIPYFRRWKLQPSKIPSPKEQWDCTKLVLLSHFAMEMPLIVLFHPMADFFGMRTWQVPLPSLKSMLLPLAFCFVFEDFYHYCAHQALHTPYLYKHIHKLHHKYSAPFGLAAEYAHPLETMILSMGTIAAPIVYTALMKDMHILTVYVWITLRLFQAIDAHSGYDFPWSLHNIIPFWSGADHHDFHHMSFTNNFSTSFRWWDRVFGTDDKFRAYKRRKKLQGGGALVEKRLLEEVEREGKRDELEVERRARGGQKAS